MSVPRAVSAQTKQLASLYKRAVRDLESWYDRRHIFRYRAVQLRKRFDDINSLPEAEKAVAIAGAEQDLFNTSHYQPKKFAMSPGGCAYEREVIPPDWVLDYWHPLEKAQYPEFFAKREVRKKEFVAWWERQYGKPDPKDLHH